MLDSGPLLEKLQLSIKILDAASSSPYLVLTSDISDLCGLNDIQGSKNSSGYKHLYPVGQGPQWVNNVMGSRHKFLEADEHLYLKINRDVLTMIAE